MFKYVRAAWQAEGDKEVYGKEGEGGGGGGGGRAQMPGCHGARVVYGG